MPFEKGESGNPGGRPKTAALSKAYRDRLEKPVSRAELAKFNPALAPLHQPGWTWAHAIAANQTMQAAGPKDSTSAARELADRTEGKAPQAIDLGLQPGAMEGASKDFLVDLIAKALTRSGDK